MRTTNTTTTTTTTGATTIAAARTPTNIRHSNPPFPRPRPPIPTTTRRWRATPPPSPRTSPSPPSARPSRGGCANIPFGATTSSGCVGPVRATKPASCVTIASSTAITTATTWRFITRRPGGVAIAGIPMPGIRTDSVPSTDPRETAALRPERPWRPRNRRFAVPCVPVPIGWCKWSNPASTTLTNGPIRCSFHPPMEGKK
mmetsp:Transcript_19112/g.40061  ORF Transcript_19112/g.40061 Transcript_19112/m.40061 type:complete len:201 (+) Transcript_19112:586-1188(+)